MFMDGFDSDFSMMIDLYCCTLHFENGLIDLYLVLDHRSVRKQKLVR